MTGERRVRRTTAGRIGVMVTAGVMAMSALSAPATAVTKRVVATFPSAAHARVSFKVVTHGGKAVTVKAVKLKKVAYDCSNGDTGTLTLALKGKFKVKNDLGDRVVRASGKQKPEVDSYQFNLTFNNRAGTKGFGSIPVTIKKKHGVTCYTSGTHALSSFGFGS